jgi:hypothetical protein
VSAYTLAGWWLVCWFLVAIPAMGAISRGRWLEAGAGLLLVGCLLEGWRRGS